MRLNAAYPVLLTFLTLALAGCRQEPLTANGNVIRFSVSYADISSASTKADLPTVKDPQNYLEVDKTTVPVWGYLQKSGEAARNVFNDKFLSLKFYENSNSWDYEGEYYWDQSATYQFRSVFTKGHEKYSGDADKVSITYDGYPDDYDLMVAATSVPSGDSQRANLQFRHACSAVRFFCVDPTRGNSTSANYTLTSFSLKNVVTAGTLTFDGTSTASSTAVNGWSLGAKVAEVYSLPSPKDVPSNTGAAEAAALTEDWFYFVPQDLSAAEIVFSFKVKETGQTVDVTRNLKALTATWEAGKIYSYFIVIQPTDIQFDAKWSDWGTTETYTFTKN